MRTLPPKMVQVLAFFAPLFSERVFRHARVLLIGAILAPGARTVSSALRALGLDRERRFHRYHRVLSRASWYGSGDRTVEIASNTAVWYSTGLFAVPLRWVLVRDPEGEFKTQALLCTGLDTDPRKVVCWFAMRWQLEVAFQEARRHLGFETQRQWSDLAIRRTTPALLGLFSLVTLFAHRQMGQAAGALRRRAAWYHKAHPTFADALALVRKELWAQERTFYGSLSTTDTVKVPRAFVERLTEAVCYAA